MSKQPLSDETLWRQFVDAEDAFYAARMALFRAKEALLSSDADVDGLIRHALTTGSERNTALRLLLERDEATRRDTLPILVDLAPVGHSDIQLVRDVILSMDAQWLAEHVPLEIEHILQHSSAEEEYRRFAELLRDMNSPFLATLVKRAATSDDPEVREVAEDFTNPPADTHRSGI